MGTKTVQKNAAIRLQAWIRGILLRNQFQVVWEQVAEKKRLQDKVHKLQKKLIKAKEQRAEQAKKGSVVGDLRQSWETIQLLQQQQDGEQDSPSSNGEEEEQISRMAEHIIMLQQDYRQLQVRTKTVEGMLKPLQKNLKSLQETYETFKKKYLKHDAKRKAVETSNQEMIRRRQVAEQKAKDFQDELSGITTKRIPLSSAPIDHNFQSGVERIMQIMEDECPDPQLIQEIRDKIRVLHEGALSDSVGEFTVSNSGSPLKRSMASLGNRSFGDLNNSASRSMNNSGNRSMGDFGNRSFGDVGSATGNRSFTGAPVRTPTGERRRLTKSIKDFTSPK